MRKISPPSISSGGLTVSSNISELWGGDASSPAQETTLLLDRTLQTLADWKLLSKKINNSSHRRFGSRDKKTRKAYRPRFVRSYAMAATGTGINSEL